MNTYNFIFIALCITVVPGVLFGIYWYYITKMGWNTLRLFALSVAALIAGGTLVIWLVTGSTWLLAGGLLTALLQTSTMFIWNITSPEIVKKLNSRK